MWGTHTETLRKTSWGVCVSPGPNERREHGHCMHHSPEEQDRLDAIRELADTLGDDIDGLAGTLDDFGLL